MIVGLCGTAIMTTFSDGEALSSQDSQRQTGNWVVILCVWALALAAVPGQAAGQGIGWAWIATLSGPGPFTGVQGSVRVICAGEDGGTIWVWQPSPSGKRDCLVGRSLRGYVSVDGSLLYTSSNPLRASESRGTRSMFQSSVSGAVRARLF